MVEHVKRAGLVACLVAASGCGVGPTELILILAIVVLLFGATRLPQLGKALGETVKSFRKASGTEDAEVKGGKGEAVQIEDAKIERTDDKKLDS
jgi:sec-independent protein translocase protein TatA